LIKNLKKKLVNLFKTIISNLFILLYGKINGTVDPSKNSFIELNEIELEKNFNYKVYFIKQGRLYTDTINDTALILKNSIVNGASFQLRNNINAKCYENIVFQKGTPRFKKKIKGKVFSLLTGGGGNSNYWHWLFDVLPRMAMVENLINLNKIDFFLLPDLKEKFQNETLKNLNIETSKRLTSRNCRHFSADQIIVTDHPYNLLNDPKKDSLNIPTWIISFLRKKFLNSKTNNQNLPKKIYIERTDSKSGHGKMRSIINENEVKDFLKKQGFEFLTLSKHHFNQQVEIFNQAECVVGLHGAGFANIVFCEPNTKVLELQSDSAGEIIKNISKKNHLNYDCISVKPKISTDNQLGHIEINIDTLKEKIELLYQSKKQ